MTEVITMGIPITIQRITFTIISIIIAKIIVRFGADAIAAFFGQNYGARRIDRIEQGYRKALILTTVFGVIVSLIFIVFPEQLFTLFLSDERSLELGADYMRIIGFSQLFMCTYSSDLQYYIYHTPNPLSFVLI